MRRMLFEKKGTAIWMSHLDTMRLMQRAFRRAGVLLHHSQGYTPHAYVSMLLPLSVGVESECEIMEYELDAELTITPQEMNAVLPEGVRVLNVYESARKGKELTHLRAQLKLHYDHEAPCAIEIEELLSKTELIVEKRTKRGVDNVDIRPLVKEVRITAAQNEIILDCIVCAQNPSLNPMLLPSAIERYLPTHRADFVTCCRMEIYDAQGEIFR
ncbi:MAG: DUF2344 domain-containing protein [Ruminococcaceae bacterium]|nr:DUF2344 domain-containing protein [Oscillospiraceae bacterium]